MHRFDSTCANVPYTLITFDGQRAGTKYRRKWCKRTCGVKQTRTCLAKLRMPKNYNNDKLKKQENLYCPFFLIRFVVNYNCRTNISFLPFLVLRDRYGSALLRMSACTTFSYIEVVMGKRNKIIILS